MIFYDWKKVIRESDGIPFEIFLIIKMITNHEIPYNKKDRIYRYSKLDFHGKSFLVYPDTLLYNAYKHSYRDIAHYIGLASFRSYGKYVIDRDTTMCVTECPVDLNIIKQNSLFTIENNRIHFLYEKPLSKENI